MSAIGRIGAITSRGTWLARGAWLLAAAEALMAVRDHFADRLSTQERRRLVEIVRSSRGRPANLSSRERTELQKLLSKVEPAELAKTVAKSGLMGRARGRR